MKKIFTYFVAIMSIVVFYSCSQADKSSVSEETKNTVFKFNNPDFSSGVMTPEILWSFGRIGTMSLSPDSSQVVYSVSHYSIEQNKSQSELYLLDLESGEKTRLTENSINEYSPVWRPDGKKIAFLATKDKVTQIFEINPDGSDMKQITTEENSISGMRYAPKSNRILFTEDVKVKQSVEDIYPDLPKANARIITDLMYRHWDTWEDEYSSHVFVADYSTETSEVSNIKDIMENEPYDSPTKPFDDISEVTFSPDGEKIAYSCKKLEGIAYATSTNTDIYLYNIADQSTKNISTGHEGYDKHPVFSTKGDKIAWESMERNGFEADKIRILVYDFASENVTNYSENFDQSVHSVQWSADDQYIYFLSDIEATVQIYKLKLSDNQITKITNGRQNYTSFALCQNSKAVGAYMSMSKPVEIYMVDLQTGEAQELSFENKDMLSKLTLGKVEKREITTTDNKQMLTWVIYPPDFDSTKKYPTLLYCQGGPQSAVSQFFSYRWNFQMMAARGYIVVAPNRRGLPGFGQAWNDQISRDYAGQDARDLLRAIDELSKESFVDENKLGAVGASYGGLSVFWLAGNHENRFKTFITHDGIFNFISMYGSTEETFFVDWDLGGPYWAPAAKNSYASSPHNFVKNWNTPILIVQGGLDFRVSESQAFEAFTAARRNNIEAELLYFPTENHWVLSPQNGILWQNEFFKWLDKYLKTEN